MKSKTEDPNKTIPPFDSIRACHGATGIPLRLLKKSKDAGCPAFRGGRVYLGDFLRWVMVRPHMLSGFVNPYIQARIDAGTFGKQRL